MTLNNNLYALFIDISESVKGFLLTYLLLID